MGNGKAVDQGHQDFTCFLVHMTDSPQVSLAEWLHYNLKTVKGYLFKEQFQFFRGDIRPHGAGVFLDS